ncbi:hypothetical protein EDC96DRAFT_531325, partial [Choanephora cucurbitarum]
MLRTAMTYKFLAPELSAQFMTAPTGKPRVIRYLVPETLTLGIMQNDRERGRFKLMLM